MQIPEIKRVVSNKTGVADLWVEQVANNLYQHTIVWIELQPFYGTTAYLEVIQSTSTSTAVASTAGTVRYSMGISPDFAQGKTPNPLNLNISDYIYVKLVGGKPIAHVAII